MKEGLNAYSMKQEKEEKQIKCWHRICRKLKNSASHRILLTAILRLEEPLLPSESRFQILFVLFPDSSQATI